VAKKKKQHCDPLEVGSAEALASARILARRAGETTIAEAAVSLSIAEHNAYAIVRMMRAWKMTAPTERLAAVCFADETVTPAEVAEWFDKPLHWAVRVSSRRGHLRRRWRASVKDERQACGFYPNDPSPHVISSMCQYYLLNSDIPPERRVMTHAEFARRWNAASLSTVSK
jgi:hypothetical protein